jgi:hypothetical protein
MKNDLHKTFGEIFNGDTFALRKQLIEIQQHKTNRDESLAWARKLRFLDISNVPNLKHLSEGRDVWSHKYNGHGQRVETRASRSKVVIPIVEEDEEDDSPRYLAVSWKWIGQGEIVPYGCDYTQTFRYYIQRPGTKAAHISSFPDRYMDRIIRVAQAHDITKIWIDTECIYQRQKDKTMYPKDKELGVQVMDLVYQNAALGVGLLTTALMHQEEVDTLACLLSGFIFVGGHTKSTALKPEVDIYEVQMIILRILSDPRWSRAWIFQEDHLASYQMKLLIPHSERVDTKKLCDFGEVHGELQVDVFRFRECVTAFCLAQSDIRRWPSNEILQKAKRYKAFNTISTEVYPSTTHSVLSDISSRSLEKEHDRVAILANALRFSTRLDTSSASPLVKQGRFSLSATLFALILINGEILDSTDDILHHTVQSYIDQNKHLIKAPHPRKEQNFIDHCRFRSPVITDQGLKTQGWIFQLLVDEAKFSESSQGTCLTLTETERAAIRHMREDEQSQQRGPRSLLDELEQEVVESIISRLEARWLRCRLADLLRRNLEIDRNPPPRGEENAATTTMLKMMAAVVHALIKGQEVRLASLHSQPRHVPPSAMFISPRGGYAGDRQDTASPVYVFTSWGKPRNAHRQERLASMEVAAYHQETGTTGGKQVKEGDVLRSHSWVNGVWDAKGERMETYVFPFMDSTEAGRPKGTKRKRNVDSNADCGIDHEENFVIANNDEVQDDSDMSNQDADDDDIDT